jgi:hypothetical protein
MGRLRRIDRKIETRGARFDYGLVHKLTLPLLMIRLDFSD